MLAMDEAGRRRILAHAASAYPEECCGFLIGTRRNGIHAVTRVMTARNGYAGDRRLAYEIPSEDVLGAWTSSRREDRDVIGIYHSHPDGRVCPSETDRRAAWPGAVHVIAATRKGGAELRAWMLDAESRFRPVPLRPLREIVA